MKRPVIIKGENVLITPREVEDAEIFYLYFNNPKIIYQFGGCVAEWGFATKIEEQKYLESSLKKTDARYFNIYTRDWKFVGAVNVFEIDRLNRTARMSFWFLEEFWDTELPEEAIKLVTEYMLKNVNLRKIIVRFARHYELAAKILNKLGFREAGVLKEHAWNPEKGKYEDVIIAERFR